MGLFFGFFGSSALLTYLIDRMRADVQAQLEQEMRRAAIADTAAAIADFRHLGSVFVNAATSHQKLENEEQAISDYEDAKRKLSNQLQVLAKFDNTRATIIRDALSAVPDLSARALALYSAGHEAETAPMVNEIQRRTNVVEETLSNGMQAERDRSATIQERGEARSLLGWRIALAICVGTAVVEVMLLLTVLRSILRPLRITSAAIRQVNAGELAIDLPPIGTDEFGEMAQAVRHFRDRAEKLNRLAYYDPLTGLGNRAQLSETIDAALLNATDNTTSIALLYLDLDRFRALDERVGNWRADRYLCELANRLQRFIPQSATLFRHGGDKFVILLDEILPDRVHHQDLIAIAEGLMRTTAEPYPIASEILTSTLSIGICIAPQDGRSAEHLIRSAEAAVSAAKRAGGNKIRFAGGQQTAAIRSRAALGTEITRGLREGEFELFYQPIVDFATGKVKAAEGLVRWRHPTRGIVMAGDFIDIAEEEGLIVELGRYCLRIAHDQARKWHERGISVRPAVNVSARQLQEGNFIELLQTLRSDKDPPNGLLDLELTESTLFDHSDNTRTMLEDIRKLGYRLGLDDFGTGYSSLSYLLRLPIDKIKIDRTFTASMESRAETLAIIQSTLTLAKALKLEVVAEGVETRSQAKLLAEMSCTLQQGFYFSRALPGAEFEEWVAQYEAKNQAHA